MASKSDRENHSTDPKYNSVTGDKKSRDENPTHDEREWPRPIHSYANGPGARPKTHPQNRPTLYAKKQIHDHRQTNNNRGIQARYNQKSSMKYSSTGSNKNYMDRAGSCEVNSMDRRSTYTKRIHSDRRGAPRTEYLRNTSGYLPDRQSVRSSSALDTQKNFQQSKPVVNIRAATNRSHHKGTQEKHQHAPFVPDETNAIKSQQRPRDDRQESSRPTSKTKTPPLSEKELQSLLEESPSDVLSKLMEKKDECLALLNQDKLTDNTLTLTLRVLSILCELDPVSVYTKELNTVLSMIETSLFLSKHLARYLVILPVHQPQKLDAYDANDDPNTSESYFSEILRLLQLFLQHKPSGYSEVGGALILLERVVMKEELVEELQQLKMGYNSVEQTQRTAKLRAMEKPPPNNFRDIPIFPESHEIRQVTKPFLRKNITQGRYENVEHYLDVQFRLLREDFVAPLREGVTEFLSDTTGRLQDIRIYKNVFIVKQEMGDTDFVYTLMFDMKPFQRVRWETSKRLLYGSFVCLTTDKFKHIACATVENRSVKNLEKGLFDIRFLAETPPTNGPFIMAESAAYFEACRHVLQGLKQIDEYSFPFKKYIVDVNYRIDQPAYLQDDDDEVMYDLSPLIGQDSGTSSTAKDVPILKLVSGQSEEELYLDDYDEVMSEDSDTRNTRKDVPILTLESWPSKEELHLDESQRAALQTALTKEFSVIQGPPGTGKTYIGLKIIEVLLHNKSWNDDQNGGGKASPILVVCYTNHALDQFLEGIIAFGEKNMVRVGSRSNSEVLKNKNLSQMRGRHRQEFGQVRRRLRETDEDIRRTFLKLEMPKKVLLNVEALEEYMTSHEYRALALPLQEDEQPQRNPSEKLLAWLRVFDMGREDGSQHAPHQQQKPPERKRTEHINVEDEGYRIQQERQIDDRYEERSASEKRQQTMEDMMVLRYAAYGPQCVKCCGKHQNIHPVEELYRPDIMTDEEAASVERLWYLKIWDRWRLYRLWVHRYIEEHNAKLLEQRQLYTELSEEVKKNNVLEDAEILRQANVIGMTTTGAAKNRQVLQHVAPRIVVVEEAAEVLEAHIITTLSAKCQHLILIGDHQQLKPNPTVYRLARWFNLDTSLFERMISNGVPCQQLNQQHRMRPEISILMKKHFYEKLEDDKSVLNMDDVRGVAHNIFFIDHQHHENEDDDNRTRSNDYEAMVLVELCQYLLHQGYRRSQITILTTYTGQLFCFRRLMDKATFEGVRVCVVDNFQGEENDIILLSLVRSNDEGSIGFLRTSNRVCVALSRARMGFYCIGNATILKKAKIWQSILATLDAEKKLGPTLPLVCRNHPNKISKVATAEDFKEMVPLGGCNVACEYRLSCGHVCVLLCHSFDQDHEEYKCKKSCLKSCDRNEHKCPLECWEECKPCKVTVTKSMSDCGHEIQVMCNEFEKVTCTVPCPRSYDICGHQCKKMCGQKCLKCPEKCERSLDCGHRCLEPCGESCTVYCKVQVERTLSKCGHKVYMDCSKHPDELKCKIKVTKKITRCGHQVDTFCCEDPDNIECKKRCEKTLDCGHQCPNVCGKRCKIPDIYRRMFGFGSVSYGLKDVKACEELVEKMIPSCGHSVKVPCYQSVSKTVCDKKCEKLLKCGHRCTNKCIEVCLQEKDDDEVFRNTSRWYDDYSFSKSCKESCERMLPCGHRCPNKCGEPCVAILNPRRTRFRNISVHCKKQVQKQLPNCSHAVNVACFMDVSSFICSKKCDKVLPCGHPCPNKCCEPCPGDEWFKKSKRSKRPNKKQHPGSSPYELCEVMVKKDLSCGHSMTAPCWKSSTLICRNPCQDELHCGHKCSGDCGSCKGGLQHKPCTKQCNRQLLCGHNCNASCGSICSPDCRRCSEGMARHGGSQLTESQPCKHNTRHNQLKTNACLKPCNQKLSCKHPCIGVCGEPCPPFCNVCNKKRVRANSPKGRTYPRDLFVYLPYCKHLCEMRYLDRMVANAKSSMEKRCFQIHSLLCPKCKEPIRHCPRYDNVLQIINESIKEVRGRCLANQRSNSRGHQVDVRRTSSGATAGISFAVGRWMRCLQGHVFYQDEDKKQPDKQHEPHCPECSQ